MVCSVYNNIIFCSESFSAWSWQWRRFTTSCLLRFYLCLSSPSSAYSFSRSAVFSPIHSFHRIKNNTEF